MEHCDAIRRRIKRGSARLDLPWSMSNNEPQCMNSMILQMKGYDDDTTSKGGERVMRTYIVSVITGPTSYEKP